MSPSTSAPFVGPVPLNGPPIYGRDDELATVANRLGAERVFLLYAPSGAGKTSLIGAGVIPRFEAEGYHMHEIIRLDDDPGDASINRFRYSMVRSLERDGDGLGLDDVAVRRIELAEYLSRRDRTEATPHLFVFDQFEELLTKDRFAEDAKTEFATELGIALESQWRYALFAIREEYLGAFDRYRDLLPNRLSSSYRLDLLRTGQARQAITCSAKDAGRGFQKEAVDRLIAGLTRRDDQTVPSPFVEPVHLQVVCLRIWEQVERMDPKPKIIGEAVIEEAGGVDAALAAYYDKEVQRSVGEPGGDVTERQVRDWFSDTLLTSDNLRRPARTGPGGSDDSPALRYLVEAHLVGELPRPQVTWYELSHDRLADAVVEKNEVWYGKHLTLLEMSARLWNKQHRGTLLLTGPELKQATGGDFDRKALLDFEEEFLKESEKVDESRRRQAGRRQILAILGVLAVLAVLMSAIVAWNQRAAAERSAAVAEAQRLAGEARAADDPNLALLLGIEAAKAQTDEGDTVDDATSALYQANGASRIRRALALDGGAFLVGRRLVAGPAGEIVVATDDGGVYWVSAPDGSDEIETEKMFDVAGEPSAIASSPGGLVAIVSGGQLVVDNAGERKEIPVGEARGVHFLDDDRLVVVESDGSLAVHDLDDLAVPRSITVPGGATAAAPLGRGLLAVGTATGEILTVDIDTSEFVVVWEPEAPTDSAAPASVTALAPDARGGLLAVAWDDLRASVVPIDGANPPIPLNATPTPVTALAFVGERDSSGPDSTDLQLVAVATEDVVRISETSTGADVFELSPSTGLVSALAALPGDLLAVATDGAVTLWDIELGHGAGGTAALRSSAPNRALTVGTDGRLIEWRLVDGAADVEATTIVGGGDAAADLAFSDRRVAIASGVTVEVIGSAGSSVLFEHDAPVRLVQFGQGSADIVTAGDQWVRIWDADGNPTDLLVDQSDAQAPIRLGRPDTAELSVAVVDVAVFGDDVFVLLPDRRVEAWNIEAGEARSVYAPDESVATATALEVTDGGLLVVGDDGGDVQLLDIEGSPIGDPFGRSLSGVVAIAASPSGRIAVAFGDRTVEVWRVAALAEEDEPEARIPSRSRIRSVIFLQDLEEEKAESVVVAADDGRLIVQPLDLDRLLDVAEAKVSREMHDRECERFDISC